MTVGELKEILSAYPDDMHVAANIKRPYNGAHEFVSIEEDAWLGHPGLSEEERTRRRREVRVWKTMEGVLANQPPAHASRKAND